jgi:hypothetical protein
MRTAAYTSWKEARKLRWVWRKGVRAQGVYQRPGCSWRPTGCRWWQQRYRQWRRWHRARMWTSGAGCSAKREGAPRTHRSWASLGCRCWLGPAGAGLGLALPPADATPPVVQDGHQQPGAATSSPPPRPTAPLPAKPRQHGRIAGAWPPALPLQLIDEKKHILSHVSGAGNAQPVGGSTAVAGVCAGYGGDVGRVDRQ